jgi:hypothetical protein
MLFCVTGFPEKNIRPGAFTGVLYYFNCTGFFCRQAPYTNVARQSGLMLVFRQQSSSGRTLGNASG